MRYLKLYESFSNSELESVRLDIKDILLEISDLGYEVSVNSRVYSNIDHISIFIENFQELKYKPTEEFIDPIRRLLDFGSNNGFKHLIFTYNNSIAHRLFNYNLDEIIKEPLDYIKILLERI